jgi:hypothetical protein
MADFDAQLPVRALAVNFTTEVANAAGTTINPAEDYAQGSTTSGENNVLAAGATTTAAPTYVTATTNPLSLDTSGNLRVTLASSEVNVNISEVGGNAVTTTVPVSGTVVITEPAVVLTYFTDAAVASNATVTHSLAGPVSLDAVHGAGSGEIKMTIAIGITGSEVTYWNGFTLVATNCEFELKNTYVIPTGSSCKVTLMNRDKAAQDLYLTFVSH